MKSLYFLLLILLSPLTSLGQLFGVGSTQEDFTSYFTNHRQFSDSLEGLWLRKQKIQNNSYLDSNFFSTTDYSSDQYIAIVVIDNEFSQFVLENGICKRILDKNFVFSTAPEKGKYIVTLNLDPDKKGEIISFYLYGNDFHINKYDWKSYYKGYKSKGTYNHYTVEEIWHKLYPK